jgi:hypothetical protein
MLPALELFVRVKVRVFIVKTDNHTYINNRIMRNFLLKCYIDEKSYRFE